MQSSHDLFVDSFPHGTVEGWAQGCRTNHCPAPVACHVFRTRFVGDYAFRKLVEAGTPVEDLARWLVLQTEAGREADRRARAAEAAAEARKLGRRVPRQADGKRKSAVTAFQWSAAQLATLRERHAAGDVDPVIADALGIDVKKVMYKRRDLGLKGNRRALAPHGTYARHEHGCTDCPATPTCLDAAQEYWRDQQAARRAGVTLAEWKARKENAA